MTDRAMQALYKFAVEPVAETLAIAQCFITCKKLLTGLVLEADIKACFDEISHPWMLEHIPMDKVILEKWLKSGFMEDGPFWKRNLARWNCLSYVGQWFWMD